MNDTLPTATRSPDMLATVVSHKLYRDRIVRDLDRSDRIADLVTPVVLRVCHHEYTTFPVGAVRCADRDSVDC